MTDVVIASAARTAIGSCGRGLASVPPSDLGNVIHTEPADAYVARVSWDQDRPPQVAMAGGAEWMSRGPVTQYRDCPAAGPRMIGRRTPRTG